MVMERRKRQMKRKMELGNTTQRGVMRTHSHIIRERCTRNFPHTVMALLQSSVYGNIKAEHCLDTLKGVPCSQAPTPEGFIHSAKHSTLLYRTFQTSLVRLLWWACFLKAGWRIFIMLRSRFSRGCCCQCHIDIVLAVL